ncbi:MAG: restriction endonuclease [Capnocytophaga sp.]|nr:restriction endonuclease [Capnocytophaga sp.]
MRILLSEHKEYTITRTVFGERFDALKTKSVRVFKTERGQAVYPFSMVVNEEEITLKADYYIGLDWLAEEEFVHIEPKMNVGEGKPKEIDFLKMLFDIYTSDIDPKHTQNLIKIYWNEPQIKIEQQKDFLTPFLIVQFLQLLRRIVRKGLKKSYTPVEENLHNRLKGKLAISQHIKHNVLKNRFTAHLCHYQVFGIDNTENRFLKKVLQFIISFKNNHQGIFTGNEATINELIGYCMPYFELVSDDISVEALKNITKNPFFREYEEAISIGKHILKRFSYNITQTTHKKVNTPPFWIDMPKLFELYVYKKLQEQFGRGAVHYHFTSDYTELDFLLNTSTYKMVIDTKYKTIYKESKDTDDIRQVSGYARLEAVYKKLGLQDRNELLDCLIIYPTLEENIDFNIENKEKIPQYRNIYKLSVSIPLIKT